MKLRIAGAIACAALAASSAAARAATIPAEDVVAFGAGTVKGYALSIRAVRVQSSPALTVTLTKRTGATAQRHVFVFDAARHRPKFALTRALRSTELRADLGPWGRIDVKLTARAAATAPRAAPSSHGLAGSALLDERAAASCGASRARRRAAAVTGTVRLTLDDTFFRTISRRGGYTAGAMTREPERSCRPVTAPRAAATLAQQGGAWTLLVRRATGGEVLQDVQQQVLRRSPKGPVGERGDVTVNRELLVTGLPASALATATGGAATVAGGAPALTGTLTFTPVVPGAGPGTVQGDLTVRFDGTAGAAPYATPAGGASLTSG